jgi:Flp pilus assembly protein TadD
MRPNGRRWSQLSLLSGALVVAGALHVATSEPIRSAPTDAAAAEALARLDSLLAAGAVADAVQLAERGAWIANDPLYGAGWQQRWGVALLRAGRTAESVPRFEAAIRQSPYTAENHRNLAAALMALERPGRAVAEFAQAVELAPADPQLRIEYGQALSSLGIDGDALREFRTAADLCGGCLAATRALALFFMAGDRPGRAKPYLERLVSEGATPWSRKALALAYLRAGSPDSAAAVLTQLAPAERDAEVWRLFAEADRARGRADPRWIALLQEEPPGTSLPSTLRRDPTFWAVVAEALRRGERPAAALDAIDLAVAAAPADTVLLVNRIVLLKKLNKQRELEAAVGQLRAARRGLAAERP